MPSVVPRKRRRSKSDRTEPEPRTQNSKNVRPDVFETLDAEPKRKRTALENKAFLRAQQDDDDTEASETGSDEFEDVDLTKPMPAAGGSPGDQESDEEMVWEDAIQEPGPSAPLRRPCHMQPSDMAQEVNDIEITLSKPNGVGFYSASDAAAVGKKGASNIERFNREQSHRMHVQFLMFHNAIRNIWINDQEVQRILVQALPDHIRKEVSKFKAALGRAAEISNQNGDAKEPEKGGRRTNGEEKVKEKSAKQRIRDWGADAEKQTSTSPYFSQGDPLVRLLRYLTAYWKKRFTITAPMLRKQGYKPTREIEADLKSFQNDPHDPILHGERVASIDHFRELAKKCHGSRDVGAQLFTALLRGLGIEAKMVASLQPVGFGSTKAEEAKYRKQPKPSAANEQEIPQLSDEDAGIQPAKSKDRPSLEMKKSTATKKPDQVLSTKRRKKGTVSAPINVESSSELSDPPSSDAESTPSLIDVTPARPVRKLYDQDVTAPTYWTEVFCPATHKCIPVSALVNQVIAKNTEDLAHFEPRGAAADKAMVVICYVLAHSSDGTAKDVTVRYVRNRIWPGKTRMYRLFPQRVAVHNRRGKAIRFVKDDWFKRVMGCYQREESKLTLADEIEDQTDLVPIIPVSKVKDGSGDGGQETMAGYKSSKEFVLERHLRRDEALIPMAKIVKHFHVGKGDKATKEPVYRREDVLSCRTVESWHKEGRQIKPGEQPMKHVPFRAVTLIRKREIEGAAKETGEKPLQGMYAERQTEWIIPDPIGPDGAIPKNAFGNIDVYVSTMVPRGAVHIPLRGTRAVCKKLGIDFAEAVTGFEFGRQRAVPVITGVVVAVDHEDTVIDAWEEQQEIQRQKEDAKRTARILGLWKKFLLGSRVLERMKKEYGTEGGDMPDAVNPFTNRNRDEKAARQNGAESTTNDNDDNETAKNGDDDMGGGFLLEDDDLGATAGPISRRSHATLEADDDDEDDGEGLAQAELEIEIPEREERQLPLQKVPRSVPKTPTSLQSLLPDATEDSATSAEESDTEEQSQRRKTSKKKQKAKSDEAASGGSGRTKSAAKVAKSSAEMQPTKRRSTRKAATKSPYF